MSGFLLDTHVLIWMLTEPAALSRQAEALVLDSASDIAVSLSSVWEINIKIAIGKMAFLEAMAAKSPNIFSDTVARAGLALLPITPAHVEHTRTLPLHHRDPFDRLLIAQAMVEDRTLVSRDRAFAAYAGLKLMAA